jgi:hypothetical protein
MHFFGKYGALLTACSIFACSTLPANAATRGAAAVTPPRDVTRVTVSDVPRGDYGARDLGRRAPQAPVTLTVTLQYNHQSELDALVAAQSDPRSPMYRHFLSSEQFNAYFAPTIQQQAYVIAALRAAGLTVTGTYTNRTLLDVTGTSASAERFFGTEIHTISQGRYGLRFANVAPATVPKDLAALIRSVSLSNLVIAKSAPIVRPLGLPIAPSAPAAPAAPRVVPGNDIADPGFESGGLKAGWLRCEDKLPNQPDATISTAEAHSGKYSGRTGSLTLTAGEPTGYSGLCQRVTVPTGGVLTAYLYQLTNETDTAVASQEVLLIDGNGTIVATLAKTANNKAAWVAQSWNLSAYAGQYLYVSFGVKGNGDKTHHTIQYVDDVSLKAAATTTCTGAPEKGPFTDSQGTLATSVADAFDFPVQHGCDGKGESVAVVIDSPVKQSDVNDYLAAAHVTQTGTVTEVPVDGGGTYSADPNSGTGEAVLDVETISGLAPGANILVYNIPNLDDQPINDAYNKIVSDNIASVVNSSFGGCESGDTQSASTTNTIAEQAAAKGITFAASSGDSGSDECMNGNNPPGPSTPASDPYFVAVGAVNFTQNAAGTLTSIAAGDDPGNGFLSGGGVSTFFKLPAYQTGVTNVITSGRNTPDVALPGVDVAVFQAGNEGAADGTSWSCPQFAALLAETIQLHNGTRLGWVNPTMYSVFKATGYADFTDVTKGNNGFYKTKVGYDQVTGIGAPKGYAFANAL